MYERRYVYWTLIAIHFLQIWLLTYTFLLFLSSLACTEVDILYCAIQMIQFISHLRHKTFHSLHWINYFDGLCVWIITHFNWFCEACMNPTSENERFNFNKKYVTWEYNRCQMQSKYIIFIFRQQFYMKTLLNVVNWDCPWKIK